MASAKETIDTATGEVLESKAVAVPGVQAPRSVMIGGTAYEVADLVNVPTLKHETGDTVTFEALGLIFQSESEQIKEMEDADGNPVKVKQKTIVNVLRVRELTSGQTMEYVCNAITHDSLNTTYPDGSYRGRLFAITKHDLAPGKRYKEVSIYELKRKSAEAA